MIFDISKSYSFRKLKLYVFIKTISYAVLISMNSKWPPTKYKRLI